MSNKKIAISIAVAAAATGIALGGASLALADPTATPSASSSASATGHEQRQRPADITGDELAKVTAAVKAKDANITVEHAVKHQDGTYEVMGTSGGNRVHYEVSGDLQTVTLDTHGPKGGDHARPADITGDELAKVTAAVKAKDANITVEHAWKDDDGYDVVGTSGGNRVHYEVSADLKTVTLETGGPAGGRHGHEGKPDAGSSSAPSTSSSPTTSSTSAAPSSTPAGSGTTSAPATPSASPSK